MLMTRNNTCGMLIRFSHSPPCKISSRFFGIGVVCCGMPITQAISDSGRNHNVRARRRTHKDLESKKRALGW